MSIDAKRRIASAFFVALLILSVFWPSPVVEANHLCCNAPLSVDDLSFLGREAPSWDVVFWCIAGLFALAMLQDIREVRPVGEEFRATRFRFGAAIGAVTAISAVIVAAVWLYVEAAATA